MRFHHPFSNLDHGQFIQYHIIAFDEFQQDISGNDKHRNSQPVGRVEQYETRRTALKDLNEKLF